MIVEVIAPFYDKENLTHLFAVGEQVEFDDKRAENIVERGLGKYVTKEAEEVASEDVSEQTTDVTEDVAEEAEQPATDEVADNVESEEKTEEDKTKRRGRKPSKVSE